VSFGTRHTLSSQTDPKRGIGASLRWTEAEFRRYSRACGEAASDPIVLAAVAASASSGPAAASPAPACLTIADARPRSRTCSPSSAAPTDPNRVVIISGHIDSRVTDVMDATKDAPGANDDGSGTAAVIEAARVLSKHKFPYTIVYACCRARSRACSAARSWPITPRRRAGR
jgi:hypothetical protein